MQFLSHLVLAWRNAKEQMNSVFCGLDSLVHSLMQCCVSIKIYHAQNREVARDAECPLSAHASSSVSGLKRSYKFVMMTCAMLCEAPFTRDSFITASFFCFNPSLPVLPSENGPFGHRESFCEVLVLPARLVVSLRL